MPNKPLSDDEKKKLAEGLGSGGAYKAAKGIMNRQAQIDAAMEDNPPPQDDMDVAIEAVRKKKSSKRYDY